MHCRARIRTDSAKIANYKEEIMARYGEDVSRKKRTNLYTISMLLFHLTKNFINRIFAEVKLMSECWPSRAS